MTVRRPYWSLLSPGTDFGGYYVPIMDPEQKKCTVRKKEIWSFTQCLLEFSEWRTWQGSNLQPSDS